jgi:hypothetical protein
MSWDVVLLKNKVDLSDTQAQPEPMGARGELIEQLGNVQPGIDFSDPSWGIYYDGQTSIEINMGDGNQVSSIMLHIRGDGNPFAFIVTICAHFGWYAIDGSTGDYMDVKNPPEESWERWKKYRDKIRRGDN